MRNKMRKIYVSSGVVTGIVVLTIIGIFMLSTNTSASNNEAITDFNNQQLFKVNDEFENCLAHLNDGRPWSPLYINDEDVVYGFTGKTNELPAELIAYNINTEQVTVIDKVKDKLTPAYIKENDKYISWIEEKSEGQQGSRIKLYNKQTGDITVVFEEEAIISQQSSPLSIGEHFILWVDYEMQDKNIKYTIKKYDINTKEVTIYRENAKSPVVCNGFIAFIEPDKNNNDIGKVYIDINSGNIKEIGDNIKVNHLDGQGDSLIMSYKDDVTNKYSLSVYQNGKIDKINIEYDDNYPQYPKISDNFIVWNKYDAYNVNDICIYDRIRNTIIKNTNYSKKVYISNQYVLTTSCALAEANQRNYFKIYGMYLDNIHIMKHKN